MSIRNFVFISALCVFGFPHGIVAQSNSAFRFTHLDVKSGLSSNAASCIITDSRGFTWIGTDNGLNCFDGTAYELFVHKRNDPVSLPHNTINSLVLEASGNILVGTPAGIARFNPWNKRSLSIAPEDPKNRFVPCSYSYVDQSGNTWCWSQDALFKLNPLTNQLHFVLACDGKDGHPDRITNFYCDRKGRYWLCSYDGLCLFNDQANTVEIFQPENPDLSYLILSAWEDSQNNFWCGTWGWGVMKFFPDKHEFECTPWNPHETFAGTDNIVNNYAETTNFKGEKLLWASTNKGLALIDRSQSGTTAIQFIPHDPASPESPADNFMGALYTNSLNQLWIPTASGVSILLPEAQWFQSFAPEITGTITQAYADRRDDFFVCTWYGNGLQRMNADGKVIRSWKHIPETSTAPDDAQVSDIVRAKDGTLWVATFGGLSHGDSLGNSFTRLPVASGDSPGLPGDHTTSVAEDNAGRIWCGTYGKGVCVHDPSSGSFTTYSNATSAQPILPADLVWTIFKRKNGEIWIATNAGIAWYDNAHEKIISIPSVVADGDTILLSVCTAIYEDSRENLWITTSNGLLRRQNDGTYSFFDQEKGLPGNAVQDIREDVQGNLWITTNGGLSSMSRDEGVIRNYTAGSGLPPLRPGILRPRGTDMLMSIDNRFIIFTPGLLTAESPVPSIYITQIVSGTTALNFEDDPNGKNELELSWENDAVSFDFVSPGLRASKDIRYQYRLVGSNDQWVNSGSRHFASYAGLTPGEYRFEVRASVRNGAWSKIASYGFTIHPPFWKTWWFIAGACSIILLLTILVVRREATRKMRERLLVLEKQQAIELERNRISKDMHDDLGSGLTKIAIMSEVVKQKIGSSGDAKTQIDTISDSARNLVDNLNEIVWALNPGNDNLRNLAAYIREYANTYLEPFDVRLYCTIPDEIPEHHLSEQSRRFLFLVVKEALHNVVKHSGSTAVTISINAENSRLTISIEDNGKGFAATDERPMGNGLKNMQERMESIGAEYTITSAPGNGTRIQVKLRLKHA